MRLNTQEASFKSLCRLLSLLENYGSVVSRTWTLGPGSLGLNLASTSYSIFPCSSVGKESTCNAGDPGSIPGSGRFPWRKKWQPPPVYLPGHGQRSLVGYNPRGRKSQTRLSDFTFTFHFHALEKEIAAHSSVLAWRIPGTGEHGGLPSMGSHTTEVT